MATLQPVCFVIVFSSHRDRVEFVVVFVFILATNIFFRNALGNNWEPIFEWTSVTVWWENHIYSVCVLVVYVKTISKDWNLICFLPRIAVGSIRNIKWNPPSSRLRSGVENFILKLRSAAAGTAARRNSIYGRSFEGWHLLTAHTYGSELLFQKPFWICHPGFKVKFFFA